MKVLFLISAAVITFQSASAQGIPDGGFVEEEQPFLRSALIVSEKPMNRVRRGVLLPLGNGYWTCFDPDLLRYAAIWKAPAGKGPLSMDSMAGISYPDEKAKADKPPMLRGRVVSQTPELPGVGIRRLPDKDIREGELLGNGGKVGPMPPGFGRYLGLVLSGERVILEYRVGQRYVREMSRSLGPDLIERTILVLPGTDPIAIGIDGEGGEVSPEGKKFGVELSAGEMPHLEIQGTSGFLVKSDQERGTALVIPSGTKERFIRILRSDKPIAKTEPVEALPEFLPAVPPFPGDVEVASPAPEVTGGPIVSRPLLLPDGNPWQRAIRPTDIAFLRNGDALITTLDGDVWRVKNIGEETAIWSRAAFGIFEPMSIAIDTKRGVFVLGRDQITRLDDVDGDGFFDVYACASDAFQQTLHTRDYATSLEIHDDGSFIIARSGLVDAKKSKYGETAPDRGSILRISPNGLAVTKLADGLRVPFMGMRADGAIFASDQQGHFIPSTPIHFIAPSLGRGETDVPFLGYEPANFRKAKEPKPPLLWYPYQINRSGASFATLSEKAFPSLGETFAHLSWSGRIFPIVTPENGLPFSWKLPFDFDFPILGAATHPSNGKLYATGIGISGYKPQTPKDAGLAEISEHSPMVAPVSLSVERDRIVVGFKEPLPSTLSLIAPRPELDLWNIKRTPKYGSGHFRWDGEPGEHSVRTGKLTLSPDRTEMTLEVPSIFKSDILRLRLHIRDTSTNSEPYPIEIYARPDNLPEPGKSDLVAVAKREKKSAVALVPGDAARGKKLFTNYGCTGCHALDGTKLTGPPLDGIATRYAADLESYLKASILDPAAYVTEGYEPSMPSFAGVIPGQDIEHIVAFLKGLK